MSRGRPKGIAKTGGRQKGVSNKLTGDVKAMILQALDNAGGANYLTLQASENPAAFMTLVGKVLPMQVTGEGGGAIQAIVEIRRTIVDPGHPDA